MTADQEHQPQEQPEPQTGTQPDAPEATESAAPEPAPVVAAAQDAEPHKDTPAVPVVGVGASAGGLDAFRRFFENLPDHTGLAFVLVQHLASGQDSMLSMLVERFASLPVVEARQGMSVQPDRIHVIPPDRDMALLHGRLQLLEIAEQQKVRHPIDFFFRSLARDCEEHAAGVILSGTGTDGTLGLKDLKEAGALIIVQEPTSSEHAGMPYSAISTGLVDLVLPPEKIPKALLDYFRHPLAPIQPQEPTVVSQEQQTLDRIFVMLRDQTGHDFSLYKESTIQRRIQRRLIVNQIEDLEGYVRYLQRVPLELEMLAGELLIGVTRFFRDVEAFQVLEERVIPRILEQHRSGDPIRIWVPGCSTGEEAYSIAMLLREAIEKRGQEIPVQIFGTDIDEQAIEKARQGVYPENITIDIPPDRLQRFFNHQPETQTYQIAPHIREMLIFALQSLIKDPPFSRLNLVSCRNLLIYLKPSLQEKVIRLLHYALLPGGFLLLGNSETLTRTGDLFESVDRAWKVFRRLDGRRALPTFDFVNHAINRRAPPQAAADPTLPETAQRLLLQNYMPPSAIVNRRGDVLYFHGRTGKYLEPASGEATLNILRMAREGLRIPLSSALRQVLSEQQTQIYERLRVLTNGEEQLINLTVKPVTTPPAMEGLILVVFEDVNADDASMKHPPFSPGEDEFEDRERLEAELRYTRENLQTTIEELETSNEELQSANEELQSANEELQSTNEELETAKEEAQSVNEELMTVNEELEEKILELTRVHNDMHNILANVDVGIILLDEDLRLRRFNPAATEVHNLIESDIGRPISHLESNLRYEGLVEDAQQVLDTLVPQSVEARSKDDERWFVVHIRPYRTTRNVIEGVVLTFIESAEYESFKAAGDTLDLAEGIVEAVRDPLLVLDAELRVVTANSAFYHTFQVTAKQSEGQLIYDLGQGQWDIPKLRELLETIIPRDSVFKDFVVEHDFPDIGRRRMRLNARRIDRIAGRAHLILLTIEDITAEEETQDPMKDLS